jgi:hypothetical protein
MSPTPGALFACRLIGFLEQPGGTDARRLRIELAIDR